jgi:uncharacterized protein
LKELILFAKAPHPGQVKTRLVPPLTFKEAAELYTTWACQTYVTAQKLRPEVQLSIAYQAHPSFPTPSWIDSAAPYFFQSPGGLGERLVQAFSLAFQRGSQAVVVIGTDSPGLPVNFLKQAFMALEEHDLTLGPADDGGYYLIGLRSGICPELFDNINWSTPSVLSETLAKAKVLGLSFKLLPPYFDIDNGEDLAQFYRHLNQTTEAPQ